MIRRLLRPNGPAGAREHAALVRAVVAWCALAGAGMIVCAGLLMAIPSYSTGETAGDDNGKIREAAVAGGFYPGGQKELARNVDDLLNAAPSHEVPGRLIALISPHAGYVYSGHVAAHGYALLRDRPVNRVIVLAPSHVESFDGVSVYDGAGYATPLGVVPVDTEFANRLAAANPLIRLSGLGHEQGRLQRGEHAIEVQLPFLQRVLGDFAVVPIVMGDHDYETCRALGVAMAELIDGPGTIIVASSDLSHFHDYDEAVRLDKKVVTAVEDLDYYSLSRNLATRMWEACGGGPVVAAMIAAERLGANRATVLKYANSGDVPAGDMNRVVGYTSIALVDDGAGSRLGDTIDIELSPREKTHLLHIAKLSVESVVRLNKMSDETSGSGILQRDLGAFVTLEKNGQLRGCIGYVVARQPLAETVRDVAAFAAVRDRRFTPVTEDELDDIEYEISVLSPLRRVIDIDQIVVGKHGLLMKNGDREGLLLPQVPTEWGWDRDKFLEQTCKKAGLSPDAWKSDQTDIFAFTAVVFGEGDH